MNSYIIIGVFWLVCVWIHSVMLVYVIPVPTNFLFLFAHVLTNLLVAVGYTAYLAKWLAHIQEDQS